MTDLMREIELQQLTKLFNFADWLCDGAKPEYVDLIERLTTALRTGSVSEANAVFEDIAKLLEANE